MAFFRNQMFNRQPMGFAPRQSRFSGGLGGLFGGMGGFNPYQQQMPRMGGMMGRRFSPMMGGGFNPMMGGGFNPYMGGGFNPMMGGGFNPMMGGGFRPRGRFEFVTPPGFEGYDFNAPIGGPPAGATPTPPPSIADLYGGLGEEQRNAFLQQFGLAPTPPPPESIERPDVDERDMFDSGSVPGEPGFSIEQDPRDMMVGTMGGPVYDDAGNLIGNLGTAGPTFPPGVLGPIGGGQRPIPPQDFGFGPGIRPTEIIGPDGSFVGSGSVTPLPDRATATPQPDPVLDIPAPQPDPVFNIPGVDLEKIRESLAKIEPIVPGISLPEPIRISEPAPTPRPIPTPRPVPKPPRMPGQPKMDPGLLPVNPFDNPLFSDPASRPMTVKPPRKQPIKVSPPQIRPMPEPMPAPTVIPAPKPIPVKGPGRIRISDPIKVPPPVNVPMPVKGPTLPIKRSPPPVKVAPLPIKRSPPPVKLPMPMPSPVIPSPIIPGPLPKVISDPVMPKPAPITRGIGGVRGGRGGMRRRTR